MKDQFVSLHSVEENLFRFVTLYISEIIGGGGGILTHIFQIEMIVKYCIYILVFRLSCPLIWHTYIDIIINKFLIFQYIRFLPYSTKTTFLNSTIITVLLSELASHLLCHFTSLKVSWRPVLNCVRGRES